MDPQHRTALIDQARVAGLFDTDFMPEEDLDTLELVETAAGDLLILTAVEAAHYADAQVKARTTAGGAPELGAVESIFGERTMVTLERLGRLRARTLEDLGSEVDQPGALRSRLLLELRGELDDLEPNHGTGARAESITAISDLAAAWRDLGGQPEPVLLGAAPAPMPTNVVNVPAGGLNELEARRLAGHVYQSILNGIERERVLDAPGIAEVGRTAVLEGLEELRTEAGA